MVERRLQTAEADIRGAGKPLLLDIEERRIGGDLRPVAPGTVQGWRKSCQTGLSPRWPSCPSKRGDRQQVDRLELALVLDLSDPAGR